MSEILQNINWLDIVYLILLLIMVYKGLKVGIGGQILSLIGWVGLLFVSVSYYGYVSKAVFGHSLQNWGQPLSFFGICFGSFIIVKFVEKTFNIFRKEDISSIERIGGGVLATAKAGILFGLIGVFLLLTPLDVATTVVTSDSRSSSIFVTMDFKLYNMINKFLKINTSSGDNGKLMKMLDNSDSSDNADKKDAGK